MYGTLRSLYYSNNIKIEEKLSYSRTVYRKLLIGEHISSIIFSIPIGILYTPFLVINDIEYCERKRRNMLMDGETFVPLSIILACTLSKHNSKFYVT